MDSATLFKIAEMLCQREQSHDKRILELTVQYQADPSPALHHRTENQIKKYTGAKEECAQIRDEIREILEGD